MAGRFTPNSRHRLSSFSSVPGLRVRLILTPLSIVITSIPSYSHLDTLSTLFALLSGTRGAQSTKHPLGGVVVPPKSPASDGGLRGAFGPQPLRGLPRLTAWPCGVATPHPGGLRSGTSGGLEPPHPVRLPLRGFCGVRGGLGGLRPFPLALFRAPLLAALAPTRSGAFASGALPRPSARLRQPPPAPAGALARPPRSQGGRSAGFSACGLGLALRGSAGFRWSPLACLRASPCARLRRLAVPPGSPSGSPRVGFAALASSRPGAMAAWRPPLPPAPGRGVSS